MRNEGQKPHGSGRNSGFLRSFSSYLRIVSNGASTVASTVRSAGVSVASSIAERDDDATRDQVYWAGFDKLECEGGTLRQVLLLGYWSGFQVWDVEDGDDVRQLVSRHDGPVSFLQMLRKPVTAKNCGDKFGNSRPLLVVVGDASLSGNNSHFEGGATSCIKSIGVSQDLGNESSLPTFVHFYSLRTHEYVHVLKFRTAVYSVRCSPRIVAVSQAAQIHCFDAGTLEREYIILTFPIASGYPGSGAIGFGPLAVGPRWLAYSGSPVAVSNTSRVTPQHLTSATSLSQSPSNGSLVAHYAKESSKQLAAGIVTLGDIGYKKLSKYCSELITDNNCSTKHGGSSFKSNGTGNGHVPEMDNVGMVIVRDIVLKSVIVQFRAHRSPIAALSFDPSGTLLVTASVNGHNINVFHIMPSPCGISSDSDAMGACTHLYRLQRGITNAVIQDISFSEDSQWIMISSSRGTSHLFAVSPYGGSANRQVSEVNFPTGSYGPDLKSKVGIQSSAQSKPSCQSLNPSGNPITLSVVSRIRHGNGWKGTVTGAAAAATGRVSPLSGAIASVFHNCKGNVPYSEFGSFKTKYYLLVFSPTGSIIQYVLRQSTDEDSGFDLTASSPISSGLSQDPDSRLVVEALQKWDVCHKRSRRDRGDSLDVYSEHGNHGNGDNSKLFHKGARKGTSIYPTDNGAVMKVKQSAEENHHMYISEVELQMHSAQVPLWAKPEIYFQAIIDENIISDSDLGGEIDIERIPTRTIEARSKELIPVFDYLQSHRLQQSRANHFDYGKNGPLMRQKSGASEDGKLSRRSSCSSLDHMSDSSSAGAEHLNNSNGNYWGASHAAAEAKESFVNNSKDNQSVKNQLEFVNSREGLKMEAQLERVNSKESLEMVNHFVDQDNDIY